MSRRSHPLFIVLALALAARCAANPLGGVVTAGSARIDQAVTGLTSIHQATDRAIINWQSFSNASGELIRFQQPGSTAVTLNRVVGADPSVLAGGLQANGRVFLINPAGILFTSTATVDTAGLVASTLGIRDADFLAGRYAFSQDPSRTLAAIINQGRITARESGHVVLIAPLVNNSGHITAALGQVAIAGTTRAVVDIDGKGLIHLDIGPTGHGDVSLPADAASAQLRHVAGSPQIIEAGTVVEKNGVVSLRRAEGLVLNSGTIAVDGAAGKSAGQVVIKSSQATVLAPTSVIRADGQGAASAGGTVAVLSQGRTHVADGGRISARGGASGNGGAIEVSGDQVFVRGQLDAGAESGIPGTVLLDPTTLHIVWNNTGTLDSTFTGNGGQIAPTDGGANESIDVATLEAFTGANIVLQAQSSIILDNSNSEGGNGVVLLQPNTSLALQTVAAGSITFVNPNDVIQTQGTGRISVTAGTTDGSLASIQVGVLQTADQSISLRAGNGTRAGTSPGTLRGGFVAFRDLRAGAGAINVQAPGGDVFVGGINSNLASVPAATSAVITAFNQIRDGAEFPAALNFEVGPSNVVAGSLVLSAQGKSVNAAAGSFDGIGSGSAPIQMSAQILDLSSRGNVNLVQTGPLTLRDGRVGNATDPQKATFDLQASGGALTFDPGVGDQQLSVAGGVNISVTGGDILSTNNKALNLVGVGGAPIPDLTLIANGAIGTAAVPIGMQAASIQARARAGGAFLAPGSATTLRGVNASGDIEVNSGAGDLTVQSVLTGGGSVTLRAAAGSILSGGAAGSVNVGTTKKLVTVANAVGTAARPIQTVMGGTANEFDATARNGGVFLANQGKEIFIGTVTANGDVVISNHDSEFTHGGTIFVTSITASTISLSASGQGSSRVESGSILGLANPAGPNLVATGFGANQLTATGIVMASANNTAAGHDAPSLTVDVKGVLTVSAGALDEVQIDSNSSVAASVVIAGCVDPSHQLLVANRPPGVVQFFLNPDCLAQVAQQAGTQLAVNVGQLTANTASTVAVNLIQQAVDAARSGANPGLVFLPSGDRGTNESELASDRAKYVAGEYGSLHERHGCSLSRAPGGQPSPLAASPLLMMVWLLILLRRRAQEPCAS